jgi:hypothetical protein
METGGDKTREVFDRYIIVGDGAAPVVTALERRELAA